MYSQIDRNKNATLLFISLFIGIIVIFAFIISYAVSSDPYTGIFISFMAFIFSLLGSITSYFFGDSIVLAMTHAIDVTDNPDYSDLNDRVETLSIKAGIPKPKVYILPDPALNAFATGRNPEHGHLAITQGLLQAMDSQELEAVIAHELGHIKNYDIRLMLIVSVLAGVLTFIADFFLRSIFYSRDDDDRGNPIFFVIAIVFAFLAPIIGMMVQFAISRKREFLADATSVEITRYPKAMISALQKLKADDRPVQSATEGNAHMFIDFPLKDAGGFLQKLFSTHPPIEERIAAIEKM